MKLIKKVIVGLILVALALYLSINFITTSPEVLDAKSEAFFMDSPLTIPPVR